jgi:cytochrome c oxidase assembly protein subunit 15
MATRYLRLSLGVLLFLQSAIVVTGGGVRLTGSGLGCPTWPECTPGSYRPIVGQAEGHFHSWIEFGNRLLTFALMLAAIIAVVAVLKSGRKDLRALVLLQFLGILGQGVLGGITVLTKLNPIPVAGHFLLSIALIAAGTTLYYQHDKKFLKISSIKIVSRIHIIIATTIIVLGTMVTGTGPHAGDWQAPRFPFKIQTIARIHADAVIIFLILTVAYYFLGKLSEETKRLIRILGFISIAQGALGFVQYYQGVPPLLVGIHQLGSILVWIAAWRIWLSTSRLSTPISLG